MGERQFGPYQLVRQIAVGGMAEIHLAKTRGIAGFEKYVALKMIHPNFSEDQTFIQMLIDEAKITVQLQHVNIAQTFDLGCVDKTYYITMEYVDGPDLYQLLRRGAERDLDMPIDVAAHVAKEVATGLDYAHRKKDVHGERLRIVHRDVSPQNVLLSHSGEVKLVDFGIAKATMRARQTAAGVIKGKYYYMSPEQAWGEPVNRRTDIFSTGIMLYEMLTGQMLYLEEDLHKLLDMVRKAEIESPCTLRKGIPTQLERIVMRALSKNREDRYQSANDLATDLERFLHAHSPVFRAPKVVSWLREILDIEDEDSLATEAPSANKKSGQTMNDELFVRERSEITDENSVIFNIRNLRPPGSEAEASVRGKDDKTGEVDRPSGFPGAKGQPAVPPGRLPQVPKMVPRSMDEETRASVKRPRGLVLKSDTEEGTKEEIEEDRTVLSAPAFSKPRGMGQPTLNSGDHPLEGGLGELGDDKTVVDSGFPPMATHHGPGSAAPAQQDTSRTLVDTDLDSTQKIAPSAADLVKSRPEATEPGAVLSANNPKPAISAVREPRRSRRTPPGTPSVGGSLLSNLVKPTPPPLAGVPVKAKRDTQPPPIPGSQPGAGLSVQPGFGGPPPDGTTTPYNASGLPMAGAFPQGINPQSLSGQMAALEVDDIPEAYKLPRGRPAQAKTLVVALLIAVCVGLGVVLGIYFFAKGTQAVPATQIQVVSSPAGATVTVDGKKHPEVTPTTIEEVVPGTKYLIEVALEGHEPYQEAIEPVASVENKIAAHLPSIAVSLRVSSSPPNANVILDGETVGQTPLHLTELNPDKAPYVEVRLRGYRPDRKDLEWTGKKEQSVNFALKK